MSESLVNIEPCIVCGRSSNSKISTKIREKSHNVLKCNNCGFIFLSNYEDIDYTNNYKSFTFREGISSEEKVIERSETLKRFNKIVSDLCITEHKDLRILEIGAGVGASIYCLRKLSPNLKIDCVELNDHERQHINKKFGVHTYKSIDNVNKKYNIVFGHHVFEHFIDPVGMLKKIATISTTDSRIYFSFPNFDDYYFMTLNDKERKKYLEFNFHIAHPYYYTKETFSQLLKRTCWEIESIDTIQNYSILNYFNWYINGERSRDDRAATTVNDNISILNENFINMVEKDGLGTTISVILKKKN
jgi:hypothetical protein